MKLSFFLAPVQAGFPSPADDHVEQKLDLNELLVAHPASTFFVRVEGHSMRDAQIYDGDVLIVDRSLQAESGSIAVAIINGEFTVKRLLRKKDRFFLVAENPAFPALEISPEMDFQVWGIVTYVIHKVRFNRL